jgi:hypothetical protein
MGMSKRKILLILLAAGFTVSLMLTTPYTAEAADVNAYWVGGPAGDWTVAANWNPSDYWPDNLNGVNKYSVFIDNNASNQAVVTLSVPSPVVIDNLQIDADDRLFVNTSGGLFSPRFSVVNTTTLSGILSLGDDTGFSTQNLLGGSPTSYGSLQNVGSSGFILVKGTAQWLNNATWLAGTGIIRDISNSGILGVSGAKLDGIIVNKGLIDIDLKVNTYNNLVIAGSGSILSNRFGQVWAPETASSTLTFQGTQTFTNIGIFGAGGMRIQGTSVNEGTLLIAKDTEVTFENLRGASATSYGSLQDETSGGMIIVKGTAQWLNNSTRLIVDGGIVSDIRNAGLLDSNQARFEGKITNTGTIAISILGASSYGTAVIDGFGGRISGESAKWNPVDSSSTLTFEGTQTLDSKLMKIGGTAIVKGTLKVAPGIDVIFKNLSGGTGPSFGTLASEFPQGLIGRFVVEDNVSNIRIANGGYLGSVGATFDGRIINEGVVNHDINNVSKYGNAIIEGVGGVISGVASKIVGWIPANVGSSLRFKGDQTIVDSIQVAGNVITEGKLTNQKFLENLGRFMVESSGAVLGPGTYRQLSGQTIVDGTINQALIEIKDGALSGTGTITGNVDIKEVASVSPGNLLGTLTINGDFSSSGNLFFEIAGLSAGQYDVLKIIGDANFDGGNINFDLIEGFIPSAGNSWDFLFATNISGWNNLKFTFDDLGPGLGWEIDDIVGGKQLLITKAQPVPEPGILILIGLSMASIAGLRRWWKE